MMRYLLFVPIVLCCIHVYFLVCSRAKSKEDKKFSVRKDIFLLDHKNLLSQPLFWIAVYLPISISLFFWFIISKEYTFAWTQEGLSNFFEISKSPLTVLATAPILGAFITSAHRSIQTEKQIKETEKKNKQDLYFSKRKFINEQLLSVRTANDEKIIRTASLYRNAFEINEGIIPCVKHDFLSGINKKLENINIHLTTFNDIKLLELAESLSTIKNSHIDLKKALEEIDKISKTTNKFESTIDGIKDTLCIEKIQEPIKTKIQQTKKDLNELENYYDKLDENDTLLKTDPEGNTNLDYYNEHVANDIKSLFANIYLEVICSTQYILFIIDEIFFILFNDKNIHEKVTNIKTTENLLTELYNQHDS